MNKFKSINTLRTVLTASAIFDMCGGIFFILLVGTGKSITNPPTHPFYAILIASFLFSLAYLQFMSAFNIRRYLLNIGVVTISRILFVILFFSYFLFLEDFPITFLPTAIADLIWSVIYIVITLLSDEVRLRDLFLPKRDDS